MIERPPPSVKHAPLLLLASATSNDEAKKDRQARTTLPCSTGPGPLPLEDAGLRHQGASWTLASIRRPSRRARYDGDWGSRATSSSARRVASASRPSIM